LLPFSETGRSFRAAIKHSIRNPKRFDGQQRADRWTARLHYIKKSDFQRGEASLRRAADSAI
jgi:hypothetical protein